MDVASWSQRTAHALWTPHPSLRVGCRLYFFPPFLILSKRQLLSVFSDFLSSHPCRQVFQGPRATIQDEDFLPLCVSFFQDSLRFQIRFDSFTELRMTSSQSSPSQIITIKFILNLIQYTHQLLHFTQFLFIREFTPPEVFIKLLVKICRLSTEFQLCCVFSYSFYFFPSFL